MVKVNYVGYIQYITGKREEELSLPDEATVEDLIRHLVAVYGDDFRFSILSSEGWLRHTAHVLVNSQDISELKGLGTQLGGEAEVSVHVVVYPAMGGA